MIIIDNNCAANQNIWMISERTCDTEDSSNSSWKLSFIITEINYFLKYTKTENIYVKT